MVGGWSILRSCIARILSSWRICSWSGVLLIVIIDSASTKRCLRVSCLIAISRPLGLVLVRGLNVNVVPFYPGSKRLNFVERGQTRFTFLVFLCGLPLCFGPDGVHAQLLMPIFAITTTATSSTALIWRFIFSPFPVRLGPPRGDTTSPDGVEATTEE